MTTEIDAQRDSPPPSPSDETQHLELPFTWENGPAGPKRDDRSSRFRFPSASDPKPPTRRLFGMALYACVVGLLGLAGTVGGLLSVISGATPVWYVAAFASTGVSCVALVVAGFLSIQQRRLPWVLLLGAAVLLGVHLAVTLGAS